MPACRMAAWSRFFRTEASNNSLHKHRAANRSSRDPSAAQDQIVLVKNSGLACGNGSLRGVQFNFHSSFGNWSYGSGSARMIIADFYCGFEGFRGGVKGDPITPVSHKLVSIEGGIIADNNAVCFRI